MAEFGETIYLFSASIASVTSAGCFVELTLNQGLGGGVGRGLPVG
jgi:hypothetical protein